MQYAVPMIENQNYWREIAFSQGLKTKEKPKVYFDISIGNQEVGRIVFELFTDLTPVTAENFRGLCTGEYGQATVGGRPKDLHYMGTQFHRIVDNFVIQGGDITNGDGSGVYFLYIFFYFSKAY